MKIEQIRERHPEHWRMAAALRVLAMDAVQAANSGHPGMPMGMADVATVLFARHLKFDAAAPDWPDRDRFVLSAGHGSMLLYGLLYLSGYPGWDINELRNFRQLGSNAAGHPEYGHGAGVETTTGPLGQGLATAVGMAIAEESLRARWGRKLFDHRTWVIAGDGCLMEGISQEAIGLAGKLGLGRLNVIWDNNGISIDGPVSLADATDQKARFAASGWAVFECDGHDPDDIDRALTAAAADPRPALIAARTHIGFGAPTRQDTAKAHGAPLGEAEIAATRAVYGWDYPPFEIPEDVRSAWAAVGARGRAAREAWQAARAALSPRKAEELDRTLSGKPPARLAAAIRRHKRALAETAPKVATRKASEMALSVINPVCTETIGGSADLTGSNNTLTDGLGIFDETNRKGRYIHYGIREHAMAAAMNGMALHGGVRPYGGTFLVFSDYARGAMRLSALMGVPVVYVMTHDSIGLGEDGPTHQPVEHLAMARATPNLLTFRPCDAVETAEAWEVALARTDAPSLLALSRQNLPTLRSRHRNDNMVARGGYVLAEAEGRRRAILIATGSEVEIAMTAREALQAEGIGTRVVSMPSWELFAEQNEAWRRKVLPAGPVRVAVEAASPMGWERWLMGERGNPKKTGFVGMTGFGASAPAPVLYEHFGITPGAVAEKVRALL